MAYCRFGCDNWKSNVYVYAFVDGGWMIDIAHQRIVNIAEIPLVPDDPPDYWSWPSDRRKAWTVDVYFPSYNEQMRWLHEDAVREWIPLPHAGKQFWEHSLEETIARLLELRELGYHVPQHALDELNEELQTQTAGA